MCICVGLTDFVKRFLLTLVNQVLRYGLVPQGLLTFLGSLYKEVAKTTPAALVCRLERQTARKKYFFLPQTLCPQLTM